MKTTNFKYLYFVIGMIGLLLSGCSDGQPPVTTEVESVGITEQTPVGTEPGSDTSLEPSLSTYSYFIGEIGVSLEIPENMYVYRVDGVYEDWDEELAVHDFCQWILITDQEYDEKTLAYEIKEDYVRVGEHIVFGIVLTPKELFPVEFLYNGIFSLDAGRIVPGGFCEVMDLEHCALKDGWMGSGLYGVVGEAFGKNAERWGQLREAWAEIIYANSLPTVTRVATAGTVLGRDYFAYTYGGGDPWWCTILNDTLWEVYCWAVDELTAYPEKYRYSQDEMARVLESPAEAVDTSDGEERTVIRAYTDEAKDISIRAFYFAKHVVYAGEPEQWKSEELLREFAVVFHEWRAGQESYNLYRRDEKGEYNLTDGGYNYFVDLQACREYIEEYRGVKAGEAE